MTTASLGVAALIIVPMIVGACGDDEDTNATGGAATTSSSGGSAAAGGAGGQGGAQQVDPLEYLDRSLLEQVAAVDEGALSCQGLLDGYLERIGSRDQGGDAIRSILALADDPPNLADGITPGTSRRLACGVVGVKDNIDVAGFATTAGSLALAGNLVDEDAPLIARLRAEDALLIGKTNLSEWANFRGNGSTSGWSSFGGQTKNGFDPAYNPCGSSSGSAAGVAAGVLSAAIGTETDGSITCPAAVNGVVGMKPTVGLVSRTGIVPISHTQDTAGPITRTVADAARLLSVMAGPDPADPATASIPTDLDLDFEAVLEDTSLDGVRLGVVSWMTGISISVDALFDAEVARLEAAGATVVSVQLPSPGAYFDDEMTVLLHEFKADLNDYLASHAQQGQPATLAELIAYNEAHAAEVMPYFGQEIFEMAEETVGLGDPAYLEAKASVEQLVWQDGIVAVMAAEALDAFIAPTMGPAWVTNYETGDQFSGGGASGPAAVAGCPHITVPMGLVGGLPVGLSIFADRWQDGEVLRLAHAYDQLPR
jgi:amidase